MSEAVSQESDVVPGRLTLVAIAVVLAVIAASALAAAGLGGGARTDLPDLPRDKNATELVIFDLPTDAERQERAAREKLSSYGRADPRTRRLRIPIEEAMDLYLERREEGELR